MTAEWIARRREIEQAATEGPWVQEWGASDQWWTIHGQPSPAKGDERMVCPEVATLNHREDWTADVDFIVDARTSLPKALDALEKVLELHRVTTGCPTGEVGGCDKCAGDPAHCAECLDDMPCSTVRVITEALTGGEHDDPR